MARTWNDGVPAKPSFSVGRGDLTEVREHFNAQGTPAAGTSAATPDDEVLLPLFIDQSVRFPSVVRDYRTPGEWLDRASIAGRQSITTSTEKFDGRGPHRLDFAAAVLGPGLPAAPAYRLNNSVVWAGTPWYGRSGTIWCLPRPRPKVWRKERSEQVSASGRSHGGDVHGQHRPGQRHAQVHEGADRAVGAQERVTQIEQGIRPRR
ncbi:hypothetical protein [Streptomyces sp. NBC_00523]|uniref:hypothetical protein n=1 Tax=Streptomyces sp. NBC_00523 TaxID=2975765 RepID=UPI003FCC417C